MMQMLTYLRDYTGRFLIGADASWMEEPEIMGNTYRIPVDLPGAGEQKAFWKHFAEEYRIRFTEDVDLDQLVSLYDLTPERIRRTLSCVMCTSPMGKDGFLASRKELEEEIGFELFRRSNRGVTITAEGEEFLNYARQVCQQYALLEDRFVAGRSRKKFSVSTQHYTFAINAFVEMVRKVGMEEYEFSILETRTYECIENVRDYKSELGILYLDEFNEKYLTKLFEENNLEFHPLRDCSTCVYLWGEHPLAHRDQLTMADLEPYPCIAFELGKQNSLFLSEEVMSTYQIANSSGWTTGPRCLT